MTSLSELQLHRRVDHLMAGAAGGPGCAIGVTRGADLLLARGYGLASVEHALPITARSVFRIASVSKQFTVTAALLLAAQGKLSLQADMRKYLPEFSTFRYTVRIEHLMRHTSGMPDFLEMLRLGGIGLDARLDRATMLQCLLRNRHLSFEPGAQFLYCNSNFLLLGLIVERICARSLADFLQAQVFAPLNMHQTRMLVPCDLPVPGLAAPYLADPDGGLHRAMHGFEHGGEGGLVSSVEDLLLWGAELLGPRHLPAEVTQQLASPTRLNNGAPSAYARGIEHGTWAGMACIGHGGQWPGYRTEFLQLPQAQLTVVVLSNFGSINPHRLAREVALAALDRRAAPQPPAAAEPPAGADTPVRLCGEWLCSELPALFTLAEQGGELQATQWGVTFALALQADGSYLPWRGAYEFRLRPLPDDTLEVDLGAGHLARFHRLAGAANLPADLSGNYHSADLEVQWSVAAEPVAAATAPDSGNLQLQVAGPLARSHTPWSLRAVAPDLFEITAPGYPMSSTLLARVLRDAAGQLLGLEVCSSRIRRLRFARMPSPAGPSVA